MPLVRLPDGTLVLFAHVPRCGGTSVERHLASRFGPLALLDRSHYAREGTPWSASSPQHAEAEVLARLVPREWIALSFAVVRHPAARLASVFAYQRDWEERILEETPFLDWLEGLDPRAEPPRYDNHARPMTDLVPRASVVFRLERGMRPVLDWIDALARERGSLAGMGRANDRAAYLERRAKREAEAERAPSEPPPAPKVGPEERDLIAALYAEDFERFGYDPETIPPSVARGGRA